MPKINEITYQSDPYSFIDYNSISAELEKLTSAFETINNSVLNTLKTEINQGGLDLYATNINGVPIYHNKAVELQQKLDGIYTDCASIISNIDKKAKEHRIEELETYIKKLEEKINELMTEIRNLEAQNNELENKRASYISIKSAATPGSKEYINASNQALACLNQRKMNKQEIDKLQNQLDGGFWSANNGGLKAKLLDAEALLSEMRG